ncbi:MAG TPA: succinylglutamate desuccinylase/aspartoacylase family protein [Balneolaceae bacterium]|nr:succinylglutamate desuccinylase/aspartoacylase family protein [Balneolaceae bacterium]
MKREDSAKLNRIIGLIEGTQPGPCVVGVGGIHGNEPAGVQALQQIVNMLQHKNHQFRGKFLALRGNLPALRRHVRYIDEDLNRIWFPSIIDKIRRKPKEELQSSERRQIKSMLHILDDFLPEKPSQPAIFVDLHSFSANGDMFAITAPRKNHLDLFGRMHVPLVFGIQKTLQGAALRYYQDRGHITLVVEGGPHQSRITVKNNVAATLTLLNKAGCLSTSDLHTLTNYETYLDKENAHLPRQVDLVYQHMIEPGDHFEMRPGFKNFQEISKGEWLASDKEGKIRSHCDGYLLMPLYQQQGNDGFFITQKHT